MCGGLCWGKEQRKREEPPKCTNATLQGEGEGEDQEREQEKERESTLERTGPLKFHIKEVLLKKLSWLHVVIYSDSAFSQGKTEGTQSQLLGHKPGRCFLPYLQCCPQESVRVTPQQQTQLALEQRFPAQHRLEQFKSQPVSCQEAKLRGLLPFLNVAYHTTEVLVSAEAKEKIGKACDCKGREVLHMFTDF